MNNKLNGLGILNTKNDSATVGSPLETAVPNGNPDSRLLNVTSETFNQPEQLSNYLKEWMLKTGTVSIESSDVELSVITNANCVFGARLLGDASGVVYNIVPCLNEMIARTTYLQIESLQPKPKHKSVIVCPCTFGSHEVKKGSAIGIEIMGNREMQEINCAISSSLPYIVAGGTFVQNLGKYLHDVYKKENSDALINSITGAFKGDGTSAGSIANSFAEGFAQLKGSVMGILGKGNKTNDSVQTNTQCIGPNANGDLAGINLSKTEGSYENYNTNVQVDITKKAEEVDEGVYVEDAEEQFDNIEYGTPLTAGTMGGEEREPTDAESGIDIVTKGTMSKEEGVVYTTGEVVDVKVDLNKDKVEETTDVKVDLSKKEG